MSERQVCMFDLGLTCSDKPGIIHTPERPGFSASCLHKRKLLLRKCQQLMKIFLHSVRLGGCFENTPLRLSIFSLEKQNPLSDLKVCVTLPGDPWPAELFQGFHRKWPLRAKFKSAENQTEKWKQNRDLCLISRARLTCLSAALFYPSLPVIFFHFKQLKKKNHNFAQTT